MIKHHAKALEIVRNLISLSWRISEKILSREGSPHSSAEVFNGPNSVFFKRHTGSPRGDEHDVSLFLRHPFKEVLEDLFVAETGRFHN